MLKTAVLAARNVGIKCKKRRFLKLILIFVGIKQGYSANYQHLACNGKNKHFLSTNDNSPANIGCMHAQNSLFVDFIHNVNVGISVFVNGVAGIVNGVAGAVGA